MGVHIPDLDDPDVIQAIEDFRPVMLELRDRTKELAALSPQAPDRVYTERAVQEIMSRITLRAERLALTTDELLVYLNADANRIARRGKPAPTRATTRTLIDAVLERTAEEAAAHIELTAAQTKMRAATAARIAAEGAYSKFMSGALT